MNRYLFLSLLTCVSFLSLPARAEQPVDPRRPAAINTEQVPPAPAEIFAQLQRYQSIRGAGLAGWSADGKGLFIHTRFGNSVQVHRVESPGSRRGQVTFYEEPVQGETIVHAPGKLLLSSSAGGDENYQIDLLDLNRGSTLRLTDGQARHGLGPISRDGSQAIISSNARNGRDTDLYLADLKKPGELKPIYETEREYWYAADFSPDGKTLLLGRYVSANESHFALLEIASGKRTDLPLPEKEPAAIDALAFSQDGQSIFIATDSGSEFCRLARFDLATRKYHWLTADIDWDVGDVIVEPASGAVAFTVNDDGASRLFILEGRELKRRELKLPLGIVASLEFSPGGESLGFTLSRPDKPTDVYSLSLAGELTRWTYSEAGGLNPEEFLTPTRISYKSFDGREIPAYYYSPPGAKAEKPAAVVIQIHGGPEGQYRPYFSRTAQFYAGELGLAVIYPNVRGSSGYGKTYLKLDNAEKREESVRDIGALLDWIKQQPELDANRVAVAGGSYGGYMVLASLIHYGERINCGIDVVGIANFISFLENTAPYRRDLRRAEYGDERDPQMRAVFEKINPVARAEEIKSALLVAHGVNDPRVPFGEAEQIADKVRAAGRPVWTVYATNEGHGFAKRDNADYLEAVEVMFLKKHLDLK